jgi:hypothetical protein
MDIREKKKNIKNIFPFISTGSSSSSWGRIEQRERRPSDKDLWLCPMNYINRSNQLIDKIRKKKENVSFNFVVPCERGRFPTR